MKLQEDLKALCDENVPSFQRSMNLLMAHTVKHFFARGFPGTTRFRSFLDFVGRRLEEHLVSSMKSQVRDLRSRLRNGGFVSAGRTYLVAHLAWVPSFIHFNEVKTAVEDVTACLSSADKVHAHHCPKVRRRG